MLHKFFRFSLLELLWMCGIFAVFLGLNMRVAPIHEEWTSHVVNKTLYVLHDFETHAGWPFHYYRSTYEVQRSVDNDESANLKIEEMKRVYAPEIKNFPGYIEGQGIPGFSQIWSNGPIRWRDLLLNGLAALLTGVLPSLALRYLKHCRATPALSS